MGGPVAWRGAEGFAAFCPAQAAGFWGPCVAGQLVSGREGLGMAREGRTECVWGTGAVPEGQGQWRGHRMSLGVGKGVTALCLPFLGFLWRDWESGMISPLRTSGSFFSLKHNLGLCFLFCQVRR